MNPETVEKLLRLSQLTIDQGERERLTSELDAILNYVEAMNVIPTENVVPLAHPLELNQPLRDDVADKAIDREALQRNAPAIQDGHFIVPRVIDQH